VPGRVKDGEGVTSFERLFVTEYLKDQNGLQSLKRLGRKGTNRALTVTASRLLTRASVKSLLARELQKAMSKAEEETTVNIKYVIDTLRDVAEKCTGKKPIMKYDFVRGVQLEEVHEFDSQGANRAAELLGKHLNAFTEKIERITEKVKDEENDLGQVDEVTLKKLAEGR